MRKAGKRVFRAFSGVGAVLRALALGFVVSCAHGPSRSDPPATPAPGSGGGVSLVSAWLPALVEGNTSVPLTWANADKRYARLAGATFTGTVTVPNMTVSGTITSTNSAGNAALRLNNQQAIEFGIGNTGACTVYYAGGQALQLNNCGILAPHALYGAFQAGTYVSATTDFRSAGVATASLPTCNSSAAGRLVWDTTRTRWVQCGEDSTATYEWVPLKSTTILAGTNASSSNAAARHVAVGYFRYGATADGATWVQSVAGTGAGNVTLRIRDGGGVLCSATHACAGGVTGTTQMACTASLLGNITLEVDGTACTTVPLGTLALSYR